VCCVLHFEGMHCGMSINTKIAEVMCVCVWFAFFLLFASFFFAAFAVQEKGCINQSLNHALGSKKKDKQR